MKGFYKKNKLAFALVWIGVYVVVMSAADAISVAAGIEKVITAPLAVILSAFLFVWAKRTNLSEEYGLKKGEFPPKTYLYFLPIIATISVNFWGGLTLRYTALETVCFVSSMLCVGFLEELVFRGFLFKALCKENVTVAIVVSSLTFGFGHIVNLLMGAEILPTLLQIAYASAAGFAFTIIFYQSGSLLPCIVAHAAMNVTSVFAADAGIALHIASSIFLVVVFSLYAVWILKAGDKVDEQKQSSQEIDENEGV